MSSSQSTQKMILVILTNVHNLKMHRGLQAIDEESTETKTGFDIKEVGYLWTCLQKAANVELVFATPKGGEAPIDPKSMEEAKNDEQLKDFFKNRAFLDQFKHTKSLEDILREEEEEERNAGGRPGKKRYACVIVPGSHGAMIDLPECKTVQKVMECILKSNGHVATIGHGLAAMLNVRNVTSSALKEDYFLKDKKVTCFTNDEEKKLNYAEQLPFFLEDRVRERGAKMEKSDPFTPKVVEEQQLLTAQNHQSIKEWIKKITECIQH
jgi:putative intracellular protease/amidase